MCFEDRTGKSSKLIELLDECFWNNESISSILIQEAYGYEKLLGREIQEILKGTYSLTAKHIRFAPDFLVAKRKKQGDNPVLLLEYKVMSTPRYTFRDTQWDRGQVEAAA